MRPILFFLLVAIGIVQPAVAQDRLATQATEAMRKAAEFYHGQVAMHGGYVYHYSPDLTMRWGEGRASGTQIWVQPPGTPTVGIAYLRAYQATADPFYLTAATDAAMALVYGQLKSGGWTNSVDFDPNSKLTADYRNGKGRGKNNSSLDDGQSQSAILFLMHADEAHQFQHGDIRQCTQIALDALLAAQYPNGGFPQVWTAPVPDQPVVSANYPQYDWRSEGRIKNYWDMYTLNDNVTGYVADVLIEADRIYDDSRYMAALRKLGDFLILAQMPQPQPGWAQQYNYQMQPIWARKFEPPGVSGDETQEVMATLMRIAHVTGDKKYLEPIPAAAAWLRKSLLGDGQLARYYELKTNRPLYMSRQGDSYTLTYDDSDLPDHYGWKTPSQLESLGQQFARVRAGKSPTTPRSTRELIAAAVPIIAALDPQGRWISIADGSRLVGQFRPANGEPFLSSEQFAANLTTLSEVVMAGRSDRP